MNIISKLIQFENFEGSLPEVRIGEILDLSSRIGLTKGSNTGEDFYNYLSCFYKIVNENGLDISDSGFPIELVSKFKIEEIYSEKIIRENLISFRKECT